jgi:DNA replication and repair protein RecF
MLKSVSLWNFRNFGDRVFAPSETVTVLYGANGAGKTNLLEAIHLAATGRSFRGARSIDLLSEGAEAGRVIATFDREGRERELEVIVPKAGMRRIRISGVPRRRAALVGEAGLVLFLPEELELPYRSPARRRTYIDRILSSVDIAYGSALSRLERTLEQRNRLLRRIAEGVSRDSELEVWDEQLVRVATEVALARYVLVETIREPLRGEYDALSAGGGLLEVAYRSSVPRADYATELARRLRETRSEQIRLRATLHGPHRDDLELSLDGYPLEERASRGEVRTAMLALKLAELRLVEERFGERPLLLLDDVFSELDVSRRNALTSRVEGYQTVITTTDADHVDMSLRSRATLYELDAGELRDVAKTR